MISEDQIKEVMRLADKIANYAWKEGFAYGEHSNSEQDHECRAETRAELEAYLRTIEPAQSVNAELLDALKDARHCIGIDRDTLVDCHTNPCTGYLDPDGALAKAEYDDVIDAADAAIARAESINEISNLPDVSPINEGNSPCADQQIIDYVKGVYAFLESTSPAGFADEAFRLPPFATRAQQLFADAIQGDELGKCMGSEGKDSKNRERHESAIAAVSPCAGHAVQQDADDLVGLRGCNSRHGGMWALYPCIYRMRTTDPGCTGCVERDEDQHEEAGHEND